jgi:hypothetical protein
MGYANVNNQFLFFVIPLCILGSFFTFGGLMVGLGEMIFNALVALFDKKCPHFKHSARSSKLT